MFVQIAHQREHVQHEYWITVGGDRSGRMSRVARQRPRLGQGHAGRKQLHESPIKSSRFPNLEQGIGKSSRTGLNVPKQLAAVARTNMRPIFVDSTTRPFEVRTGK